MKTHIKATLAMALLLSMFSSLTRAELFIESVYPNVGKVDEDLSVTVRGGGFDEHTRVFLSPDTGSQGRIVGAVDTRSVANGVAVAGQTAYLVTEDVGLEIIDVSDPGNPSIAGSVATSGYAKGVAVAGQTAYVADGRSGLQVVDASDPQNPAIVGSVDTPGDAYGVAVAGQIVYVADGSAGLQVVDAGDPQNPVIVGSVDTPGYACGVAVLGQTAYVADEQYGLQVVDASDPQNPAIVGSVDTPFHAGGVAALDQTAYVADLDAGLQIVDVSDPQNPVIVGSVDTVGWAYGVAVLDQTAYVADYYNGLQVVDVSDPSNPAIVCSVDTIGFACGVAVLGHTAYVADGYSGLQVVDVSEPLDTAFVRLDMPGWAYGVAVLDQIAYVAGGYAGLQIVDVSDLRNLSIIGSVDIQGPAHGVEVLGQTAYVTECMDIEELQGEFGLKIIDVSDPLNPAIVGSVNTPGWGYAVAVLDQIACVADGESGLQVVNVSDPANPAIVGSLDMTGWTRDVAVSGLHAYVADGYNGLRVVDVSDPLSPAVVASVEAPEFAYGVEVLDQTAYVADGFGGLRIVDVSEPHSPVMVGALPTLYFNAEGVAVLGRTVYMEDDECGIMVIDTSDWSNPVTMGVIDIPGHAEDVVASGVAAYVASGPAGLTIVQVPVEIYPVQVIGPSELRITLPGQSIAGHYNISVFNQEESDELVGAVSFLNPDDYQAQLEKKAIVAAGGTGDPSDRLVVPVRNCANLAYLSLMSQGYSRETIRFLAPHTDWDVDGDGLLNDVDDVCTTATLSSAITGWGADSSELVVFLVDHGGVGTFYANADDIVQATDLDYWMDVAQWTIAGKAVLIYDACYSGSFLAQMFPPPGKERIVVASSLATERAWFMNDGALSFGYQFWASVFLNANLYESFVVAKNMMAHDQTAVLDANGDGEQTKEDVELVRDFVIGRGRTAASTPPLIGEVSEEQVLSETSGANLWASDIVALNEIERVWAVIVPPDFDNASGAEVTGLDTVELTDPDQDGVYIGAYDQFDQPGTYDVFVYASDVFQAFSLPKATTVVVVDLDEEGVVYVHPSGDCGFGREPCYDTVQQGLGETGRNAFRIKIAQGDYCEDLNVSNDCQYTLSGGYDSGYEGQSGLSAIIGSLTIVTGRVEIENLALAGQ